MRDSVLLQYTVVGESEQVLFLGESVQFLFGSQYCFCTGESVLFLKGSQYYFKGSQYYVCSGSRHYFWNL